MCLDKEKLVKNKKPKCLVVHNSLYEALFFAFISYKIAGPLTSNL